VVFVRHKHSTADGVKAEASGLGHPVELIGMQDAGNVSATESFPT
jgi:hypothetical protein